MAKSKKKSNPGSNKAKTHPPADEVTGLDFLDSIPKQWKRMYPLLAYTTGMPHHCFREVQIRPFNPKETVTPEDKRGFTEWVEFYRDQDEDGELWILHNVPTYHEKPPPGSMLRGFGIPNETSQWRHTLIVKDPLPVFLEPIELPLLGWHLLRLYRDDAAWSHVQLRFQDLSLDPLIWAEMKTMMVSPIHNWAQFRVRMKKFITALEELIRDRKNHPILKLIVSYFAKNDARQLPDFEALMLRPAYGANLSENQWVDYVVAEPLKVGIFYFASYTGDSEMNITWAFQNTMSNLVSALERRPRSMQGG